MKKKYELLPKNENGLHQIKALIDILYVCRKGDLGGYIKSEKNLSHEGRAWVSDNARVYGNAHVSGKARVYGNAWVSDNAWVHGNARVFGEAQVYGEAEITDNAEISGVALVSGNAHVSGNAQVSVSIDYDCDFNVWKEIQKLLYDKKNIPILMGLNPHVDKILAHKLKE